MIYLRCLQAIFLNRLFIFHSIVYYRLVFFPFGLEDEGEKVGGGSRKAIDLVNLISGIEILKRNPGCKIVTLKLVKNPLK